MAKPSPRTIIMPTEFFYPYAQGGSEWSTYYLATSLRRKGYRVIILTPCYNGTSRGRWEGLTIERFSMGKKLSHPTESVTPFWHTNPWWILTSTIALLRVVKKYKADIIHVQGKYFLPATLLTKRIRSEERR